MDVWELEVRESVRQVLADYTAATDRFDVQGIASCFAPAGVLAFTGGEPMVGPAAIATGLGSALGMRGEPDAPAPTHVRHHVSSVRFATVSTERVEVISYFAVHTDIGLDHWGRYRDVLVLDGDRWLFAHRRIAVDGFSAASLMKQ
jgi:hypothetical protein